MTDSFGAFLQSSNKRGLQDSLSLPRLILAALTDSPNNAPMTEEDLYQATLADRDEIRKALQKLASDGLVTATPEKGGLKVEVTPKGRVLRAS